MFFIPGWLISMFTFPGVILHEWAHEFFCKRLGVAVHEVKYFQLGKKVAGYVKHEIPTTYKQTFWISIGPLLVNSLAAIAISFVASQTVSGGWLWCVLFWLAISAGMHSFPSDHDMSHIASASKSAIDNGGSFLHYLAFPFVWLVKIANVLRVIWFDAIWAILLISIGGGFGSFHDITTTKQDKLSSQIEVCKTNVTSISNQVDNDQAKLDAMDSQMTQYQNSGDENDYNSLVAPYNTLLTKIKEETSNYENQRTACNDLIDEYNK